jgi:hypothetical protein
MAETTITGLPNATTPLDGTERVPMDQNGATVDASTQAIANLAAGAISSAVAAHVAAADPHPGYLTAAEGDAAYVGLSDARLSDAREWTATTISQAEAEAGTETTRRAFTAQRVFQAVAAWWAASTARTKLDGIEAGAQVNVATDLTYDAASREVRSSTGTDATLPLVSTSSAGLQPARSFSAITYGATVALDFASLDAQYRTISLTGNLELTTTNLANGRTLVIRLVADANQRTFTFPTDWKFLGTKPANIAASKVGVLSITAFGTTNADVVAAYAVQS